MTGVSSAGIESFAADSPGDPKDSNDSASMQSTMTEATASTVTSSPNDEKAALAVTHGGGDPAVMPEASNTSENRNDSPSESETQNINGTVSNEAEQQDEPTIREKENSTSEKDSTQSRSTTSIVRRLRLASSSEKAKDALHDVRVLTRGDPMAVTEALGAGAARAAVGLMKRHGHDAGVQAEACAALCNLASIPDGRTALGSGGGATAVVDGMKMHTDSLDVQIAGCAALCNLTLDDESNRTKITNAGGKKVIEAAIEKHGNAVSAHGRRALVALEPPSKQSSSGSVTSASSHGFPSEKPSSRAPRSPSNVQVDEVAALAALREIDPELKAVLEGAVGPGIEDADQADDTERRKVIFDDSGRVVSLLLPEWPRESLPAQLGLLHNLKKLDLMSSSSLKALPLELNQLTNLEELILADCSSLQALSVQFWHLKSLNKLDLTGCTNLSFPPKPHQGSVDLVRTFLFKFHVMQTDPNSIWQMISDAMIEKERGRGGEEEEATWAAFRSFANDASCANGLFQALQTTPQLEMAAFPYVGVNTLWDLVTQKECRAAMRKALLLFGRFQIHRDVGSSVCLRQSHGAWTLRATEYLDDDENKQTSGSEGACRDVLLKIVTDASRFINEVEGRRKNQSYAVELYRAYYDSAMRLRCDGGGIPVEEIYDLSKDLESHISFLEEDDILNNNMRKSTIRSPKCLLVLQSPKETLNMADLTESLNGDLFQVRQIVIDIATGLAELHSHGILHGDINSCNIVRVDSGWKLINFDASCKFGEFHSGPVYSNVGCAPDVARSIHSIGTMSSTRDENTKKCVAHAAQDFWSLGTVIFEVILGKPFWHEYHDGSMSKTDLKELRGWTSQSLFMRLKKVGVPSGISTGLAVAFDLVRKLLDPISEDRIEQFGGSISGIFDHPFLNGRSIDPSTLEYMRGYVQEVITREQDHERYMELTKRHLLPDLQFELSQARDIMLRGILEPPTVRSPTSFVILQNPLPLPESANNQEFSKTASFSSDSNSPDLSFFESSVDEKFLERLKEGVSWVRRIKDFVAWGHGHAIDSESKFSAIEETFKDLIVSEDDGNQSMFMYIVDDLTGSPVFDSGFPVEISNPLEVVPKLLPMMQMTVRAACLSNGVLGLAKMFGFPLDTLPESIRVEYQELVETMKRETTMEAFGSLSMDVSCLRNCNDDEELAETVRGTSLMEFLRLLEDEGQTRSYANLKRYEDDDGIPIWTTLENGDQIKEVVEAMSSNRRIEEQRSEWNQRVADAEATRQELRDSMESYEELEQQNKELKASHDKTAYELLEVRKKYERIKKEYNRVKDELVMANSSKRSWKKNMTCR